MKLRLRENTIRIRLLQTEVSRLSEEGFVSETITFSPTQSLKYTLRIDPRADSIVASFKEDEVLISIPKSAADSWISTDQVGMDHDQVIDQELSLNILIEKDFVCLTRPMDGDNLDAFPNPEGTPC